MTWCGRKRCGRKVRTEGADGTCGRQVRTEGCGRHVRPEGAVGRVTRFGTANAIGHAVAVRHFSELIAWQLSEALRAELWAISARANEARDYRFRDQLRASALSAPANIAEGFGRYAHGDFARFCDIAIGSLTETDNHLKVARREGYVNNSDYKTRYSSSGEPASQRSGSKPICAALQRLASAAPGPGRTAQCPLALGVRAHRRN